MEYQGYYLDIRLVIVKFEEFIVNENQFIEAHVLHSSFYALLLQMLPKHFIFLFIYSYNQFTDL